MTETELPQEPAPEREDRHSEPYAVAADRLGLNSPQRLSEGAPASRLSACPSCGRVTDVGNVDQGDGQGDQGAKKEWPYDY